MENNVKCLLYLYALKNRDTGVLSSIALAGTDEEAIANYRKDFIDVLNRTKEDPNYPSLVQYLTSCDIYTICSLDIVSGELVPIGQVLTDLGIKEVFNCESE